MAKSRTEPASWTNPEVRFERSDIQSRDIVVAGLVLAFGLVAIVVAMLWYGKVLVAQEQARKVTDLPPALVDANRLPPEPRLEAMDDLLPPKDPKKRSLPLGLFPERAKDYLKAQRELLEQGDGKNVEPIAKAIDSLAGKLRARPEGDARPMLPSESNSGRTTGGR